MEHLSVECPAWLVGLIEEAGGEISFCQYMDWALNHPINGAYGSGCLKIGKHGDFVTSPSLGDEFAELLFIQIIDWFSLIEQEKQEICRFSLVEIGPGEGHLIYDISKALLKYPPKFLNKLEIVLVETNPGMIKKQRKLLENIKNISIRWANIQDLISSPVVGLIIAHEVLDSIPFERLVCRSGDIFSQGVKLHNTKNKQLLSLTEKPLNKDLSISLNELQKKIGLSIPPEGAREGWSTELHIGLDSWFSDVYRSLDYGYLLVIDYALSMNSYYSSSRQSGTILTYLNQVCSEDFLSQPGKNDITSHICLESMNYYASKNSFQLIGSTKQGQALLALGLAQKLHSLSHFKSTQLANALRKRESLLRLIDPYLLGSFNWTAFFSNEDSSLEPIANPNLTKFLQDPNDSDF